jgi:hypothetical protein
MFLVCRFRVIHDVLFPYYNNGIAWSSLMPMFLFLITTIESTKLDWQDSQYAIYINSLLSNMYRLC